MSVATPARGPGARWRARSMGAVSAVATSLLAGVARADEIDAAASTLAGPAGAQGVAMLKLLAALGAVLLVFWACARLVARVGGGGRASAAGLEVLGSVALGQRERVVVVRAGGTRLVLGVTAHAITPVHVLEGDDGMPPPSRAAASELPSGADFAARLRVALGRTPA